jgi:hypothetical protein
MSVSKFYETVMKIILNHGYEIFVPVVYLNTWNEAWPCKNMSPLVIINKTSKTTMAMSCTRMSIKFYSNREKNNP